MTDDADVSVFLRYCGLMMDIDALLAGWEESFVQEMANLRSDSTRESFRRGFAKSLSGRLTLREYEKATG